MAVLRALGTTCGICQEAVDFTCRAPDGRCVSVDHIVPKALGGTDDFNNLQVAHLRCNQSKHLRSTADKAARKARQSFYDKQRWRDMAKAVRNEEPLCRLCGDASTCAVHITPLSDGGDPWDRENIQAVCTGCRNRGAQAQYRAVL